MIIKKRIKDSMYEGDQATENIMKQMTRPSITEASVQKNKPVHYSIESIDDFPMKLNHIDLTLRMLSTEDQMFGGFMYLFQDFFFEVRQVLETILLSGSQDPVLVDDYIRLVNRYVMRKLHSSIWGRDRLKNPQDKAYSDKLSMLHWVTPKHVGLADAERTTNHPMWQVSARHLQRIEEAKTPEAKQHFLDGAIDAICYAYSLSYPGREGEKKAD